MSQRDSSGASGDDATGGATGHPGRPDQVSPRLSRAARWGIDSGAAATVGAGAALVAGLRALRRGDRQTAFVRLFLGGLLGSVAVTQRRSGGGRLADRIGIEESDVVDTGPDIEGVSTGDRETTPQATGDEASEVVDVGADIEEPTGPSGPDVEAAAETSGADEDVATRTPDQTAERDPKAETSDVGPGGEESSDGETESAAAGADEGSGDEADATENE
jgi:hypothetical protein